MAYHGDGVPPRGFSRYSLTGETDPSPVVLAHAEPATSLVTLYPPEEPAFTGDELILRWYELYGAATLEELHHGLYTKVGGIRNLRLLEQKCHDELWELPRKPPHKAKVAVVQSELAAEKLLGGMVELVETHDIFATHARLYETGFGDRAEDPFVETLARRFGVKQPDMVDVLSAEAAATEFDRRVVNLDILEKLQWLRNESGNLTIPHLAVAMALDIPFTVAPLTVPGGMQRSVDEIDFHERFDRIVDAVQTPRVRRELADSDDVGHQTAVMRQAVQVHAPVFLSDLFKSDPGLGWQTAALTDFTLPILDAAFDAERLDERAGQRQLASQYETGDWWDAALANIMEELFLVYGAVSPDTTHLFLNPYIGDEDATGRYHARWVQEFISRRLTEQVLQDVIDGGSPVFRDPLKGYDLYPLVIDGDVPVDSVRQVATSLSGETVAGEEELRRLRAARTDTAG